MKKDVLEHIFKRPRKMHLVSYGVNEPEGRMTQDDISQRVMGVSCGLWTDGFL